MINTPKLQIRNLKNQYPYSAKCRFYRNSNDNIFNKETSQSRRLISKIFQWHIKRRSRLKIFTDIYTRNTQEFTQDFIRNYKSIKSSTFLGSLSCKHLKSICLYLLPKTTYMGTLKLKSKFHIYTTALSHHSSQNYFRSGEYIKDENIPEKMILKANDVKYLRQERIIYISNQ